jgi:hypothetical protein
MTPEESKRRRGPSNDRKRRKIRAAVEQRFATVARSPDQEKQIPVGAASTKRLGYDPQEVDALPASVTESFCGMGNPLGLGKVRPGQSVLDLDSLLAVRPRNGGIFLIAARWQWRMRGGSPPPEEDARGEYDPQARGRSLAARTSRWSRPGRRSAAG